MTHREYSETLGEKKKDDKKQELFKKQEQQNIRKKRPGEIVQEEWRS